MNQKSSGSGVPPTSIVRGVSGSGPRRRYAMWGFVLLVLGIALAVATGLISGSVRDRRLASCDGTILLPTSGFVVAWASAGIGLVAVVLSVAALISRPSPGPPSSAPGRGFLLGAFCALAVFAFLFDLLFLRGAYSYAIPTQHLCSG